MNKGRFIFATGGSGGHIYPALAVAEDLRSRGFEVLFVGQQGGMEESIVPEAGFEFAGVRAGKWSRGRPDPRQGLQAGLGLWDAMRLVYRHRPGLVVGFGGFASFPALAAASLLRIPIALHEQNAFPGRVTRAFAKRAKLVALASAEAARHLPGIKHAEVAGLPIREQRVDRAEARRRLGLPAEALVTLVMGGSQGSLALNEAAPKAFRALPEAVRRELHVIHSCGRKWLSRVETCIDHPNYHLHPYVDTTLAWPAADLAITRAGMGTLAEAAFHGVPLIMVPLPSAAENHQVHNAQAVESAGAGRVVVQNDLDRLGAVWQQLLADGARARARAAAQLRSPEGATGRFADRLEQLIRFAPRNSNTTSAGAQEST